VNQLTIHAQIVDQVGLAQIRSTIVHGGAWPQKVEHRTHSFQLKPTEWRRHQSASTLNVDHDTAQTIGRLVALERGLDGALWGTWQSSELGLLKGIDPWYVSGEAIWAGGDADAHDIQLLGAAMVRSTAASGTRPAVLLVGRLDDKYQRSRWRLQGDVAKRIERAAEQLQRRRSDTDAITIHDEIEARAMRRSVEQENRYPSNWEPRNIQTLGRPIPPQLRPGWKPGMIEWSQAGGQVISVR